MPDVSRYEMNDDMAVRFDLLLLYAFYKLLDFVERDFLILDECRYKPGSGVMEIALHNVLYGAAVIFLLADERIVLMALPEGVVAHETFLLEYADECRDGVEMGFWFRQKVDYLAYEQRASLPHQSDDCFFSFGKLLHNQ